MGLRGAGGAQGVKNIFFFKHGHVEYKIDGDDEQNRIHIKFSSFDPYPRVRGWGGLQAKYLRLCFCIPDSLNLICNMTLF